MKRIVKDVTDNGNVADFHSVLKSSPESLNEMDCYYDALAEFHHYCYNVGHHEHALRWVYALANLCEMKYDPRDIIASVHKECFKEIPSIDVV